MKFTVSFLKKDNTYKIITNFHRMIFKSWISPNSRWPLSMKCLYQLSCWRDKSLYLLAKPGAILRLWKAGPSNATGNRPIKNESFLTPTPELYNVQKFRPDRAKWIDREGTFAVGYFGKKTVTDYKWIDNKGHETGHVNTTNWPIKI